MAHRNVIENVPKVAFAPIHDGKFEFTPFPSCLRAVLKSIGYEVPYHRLLGASGAAFRLVWHSRGREGGNVDIVFMDPDPLKPLRRAFEAAGYNCAFRFRSGTGPGLSQAVSGGRRPYFEGCLEDEEAVYREQIVRSIDAGKPLIGFGVVGPPEACIITGYDDGGDVLTGWSMFQEHMDPIHDIGIDSPENPPTGYEESGYFRRSGWFAGMSGLVTLGERKEPDLAAVYRDAIGWIPSIIEGPASHEFHTGQRAYLAYIEELADDSEFPEGDREALALRKMVHYDAMTMIAERSGGADFIREIADHPGFEPARICLLRAADAFAEAGRRMEGWWKVAGPIWDDEAAQVRATADPKVRREFIPYVERARDMDHEGAEWIERANETLGG